MLHTITETLSPNNSLIESLTVFLKLKQFKYLDSIIEERGIKVDGWNHALLKSVGAGVVPEDNRTLEWILDRGNYKTNHPLIALCIYCQCNNSTQVAELLGGGLDPTKSPWKGAEDAFGFAIHGDSQDCIRLLIKKLPANELAPIFLKASSQNAPKCTIEISKEFKHPVAIAKGAWDLWSQNEKGSTPFPTDVAASLANKLTTPDIKRLLKPKKGYSTSHKNILAKEIKTRNLKIGLEKNSKELNIE
jgi:hypothetical protein